MSTIQDNNLPEFTSGSNYRYILTIAITAAIAGILYGFDTGVIAGALSFIDQHFHISSNAVWLKGWIVSAVPFGALVGAVFSSYFSHRVGRRRSIIFAAILFIIGALTTSQAFTINMIIAGRLLMGFAVGLSSMIVPMYLSEISPYQIRGALVFMFQLAITIGLLVAALVDYFFASTQDWRAMFLVGLVPSILLGAGMLMLPNSPRWLVLKGRHTDAEGVLRKLRAKMDVSHELDEIKETLQHRAQSFKALFSPKIFPLVFLALALYAFQQMSGINTVFYYAPLIFHNAGFHGKDGALIADVAATTINVLATIVGVWIVDSLGRRPLLFIGQIGVVVCMAALGCTYLGFFGPAHKDLVLALVLIYIVFFAISLGGIPYVIMSELFPLKIRSMGMAAASCSGWVFNILVSWTFLKLVRVLGIGHTYWLYSGLSCIGLLLAFWLMPETKNVSLEKIEQNLYSDKPLRQLGDH